MRSPLFYVLRVCRRQRPRGRHRLCGLVGCTQERTRCEEGLLMDSPPGLNSVGTVIPSFHRCKRSETMGRKNRWISSGFCSFGPGRMLVHIRFDVRYLEHQQRNRSCEVIKRTDIQVAGCRSRMKSDTTSERVRCCCECMKT
jgi:hypothetical protein